MSDTDEIRRRRVLFRAQHRGTKETDLMVGGFVARHIAGFSESELTQIEAVMELLDVDLAEWLSGQRPVPPEFESPMLRRMVDDIGQGKR
jgi:antitoxin CptB